MRKIVTEDDLSTLRDKFPKGITIYGYVDSVSISGLSRNIKFYIIDTDRIINVTHYIINVCKLYSWNRAKNAVHVNGCGMDMIFAVVSNLGRLLYNDEAAFDSQEL